MDSLRNSMQYLKKLEDVLETYLLPHMKELQIRNGAFPYDDGTENVEMTGYAAVTLRRWFGPDDENAKLAGEYLLRAQHEGRSRLNPWLNYKPDPKFAAVWAKSVDFLFDDCPEVREEIEFIESTMHNGKPDVPGNYAMQEVLSAAMEIIGALPANSSKLQELRNFVFSQQKDGHFALPFTNTINTTFAKVLRGKLKEGLGYAYWNFSGGQDLELTAKFVNCEEKPLYGPDRPRDLGLNWEQVKKAYEEPMRKAGEYLKRHEFPLRFVARLPYVALDSTRAFIALNGIECMRQTDCDVIDKVLGNLPKTPSGIIKTAYSTLGLTLCFTIQM